MPLRNQITAKLSARSVYSKQAAPKENVERRGRPRKYSNSSPVKIKAVLAAQKIAKRGRGRPKKTSVTSVKVKSSLRKKSSPKVRKRKNSVTFKNTAEVIENNSSEADLSSEGEETDQLNEESPMKNIVQTNSDDNEIKNDEESSGDEGDIEDIVGEDVKIDDDDEEDNDKNENDSEENKEIEGNENVESEIDIDDEIDIENEEQNGSGDDNDVCYSFPQPSDQPTTSREATNSMEGNINDPNISKKKKNKDNVRLKKKEKDGKIKEIVSSKKRNIIHDSYEEPEELINEISPNRFKKKRKKSSRANWSTEERARNFNTPGSSRASFSPQHLYNLNPPSSFRSSLMSPHPRIDSMDSLIRYNKSVPCGNVAADQAFCWLISPTLPEDFFNQVFEKMALTVERENSNYYKDLFSGNDLNTMLKEHNLEYGVHIDVVKYVKGMRIPVSADGRAYYSNVWEDYKQGFSLRVRNPQAYNKNLWKLCTLLQEYFSSSVGCNIYLTPPCAQGFPPHYDDIDAFIVQVEGRKYWKVYNPRYSTEELARYSSKDFTQDEIGDPYLEICLNAGDMLYIPRGYIHQAATDNATHSLHLTFSTNQLNTWGDLLLTAASKAVEKAMLINTTFRESIPRDYMDFLGTSVAGSKAFKRYELLNKVQDLAKTALTYIDVDEAADLHSLKFIQSALPPIFNKIEKEHSLHGNGTYWKNSEVKLKGMIDQYTEIQLIKKRILRLVISDLNPRLYHTLENQRDPRPAGEEETLATYVEFEMEGVPSYLCLLNQYPDFIQVKDLPLDDLEDKISFATSLYENGLLLTKEPLPRSFDEDFDWRSIPDVIPSFQKKRF